MAAVNPSAQQAARVVLAGPPQALRGELILANPSPQPLAIRQVEASIKEGDASRAFAVGRLALTLRPGERRSVVLQLDAGPSFPAGNYTGQVSFGPFAAPATFLIAPVAQLEVFPKTVVLRGKPGQAVSAPALVVRNAGNQLEQWGEFASVPLSEGDSSDDSDEKKEHMAVTGGPLELAPGAAGTLTLKFELPDKLHPGRRYEGPLYLADAAVRMVVFVAHAPPKNHKGPKEK